MEKEIEVGLYNHDFNKILNTEIKQSKIIRSEGLISHLIKRKHFIALKYIDSIPDIIKNPDYIGINPNEKENASIEFVKCFKDNILLGIKVDSIKGRLYVSTMYDISDSKLKRRLYSKRLVPLDKK
mgnify:CR=1 FL=1